MENSERDGITRPPSPLYLGFPDDSDGKAAASMVGELCSIPASGKSPGEGNGNPPQYSCLENCMNGEVWRATVHEAKSRTRLNDFTFFLSLPA